MSFQNGLPKFLRAFPTSHNQDLIDRIIPALPIEIQINARTDIGTPVDEAKPNAARDHDGIRFYNVRYPKDAATKPDWNDRTLDYPLDEYCADVGSTGFGQHGSIYVAADIDSIIGHAIGIADADIARMDRMLESIDYVENRRSTGGAGRHLYTWLQGFDTYNHLEHKAVARAWLVKLCHDLGEDLTNDIDCFGSNTWFWSRRATEENRGFELLKSATRILTLDDLPNWRQHLDVVTRKRAKVQVKGIDEQDAASQSKVRRDDAHDRILSEYRKTDHTLRWHPDHNLYEVHTGGLKKVHDKLELPGAYETTSRGKEPGKPNSVLYLRPNGAFLNVRYNTDNEHPLWNKTANGNACILFNAPATPKAVCRAVKATWIGDGFTATMEQAKEAAKYLRFSLPKIGKRSINFLFKSGSVTVECERKGKESPTGWGIVGRKLRRQFEIDSPQEDGGASDDFIRHLQTPMHEDAGWALCRSNGTWGIERKDTLADALVFLGYGKRISTMLGAAAMNPWTIVNEPFQPEFLSGRRWNRHGRKLIVPGTQGNHPHFDMIFAHCAKMLDEAVANDPWCAAHGVMTGARYLLLWAASLVSRPKHPLPYLFLWSNENNTGKSSLHRALGMLIEGGATDVQSSLTEHFNLPMAGAVLCYVEEASLPKSSYAKIKSWIDSPTITIREMRTNAYTLPNYAKFIHTAQAREAFPLEAGDERVVVIRVPPLDTKIPWTEEMAPALRREAPNFLATLQAMAFPAAAGRLFLPVLTTHDKLEMMGKADSSDRGDVICSLTEAVIKLIEREGDWRGYAGELLKAIGKGPWTDSAGTLIGYLKAAIDAIQERGVAVEISPTVTKGQRLICIRKSRQPCGC